MRTPVWFATAPAEASGVPPTYYVYAATGSGKAKRLRGNGRVRIAACDARGGITGPWFDARAEIVSGVAYGLGMRLLDRKYWPWKRVLDLWVRLFPRDGRIVIAISPVGVEPPVGDFPPAP